MHKDQPPIAAASSIPDPQGKLPWAEALQLVWQAAQCVRSLHQAGQLHGGISGRAIRVDPATHAITLLSPGKTCSFGGPFSTPDHCPPALRRRDVVELPTDAASARQVLARAGIAFEPTWIDVYQLGTLLCRLGTGEPVSAYLSSPRTKASVPPAIQTLIDRAQGYPEDARFTDAGQLVSAVEQALRECRGEAEPAVPAKAAGDALPFTSLGHFQIVARIGQGGMGDVYKGYDPALQRAVAIKVLPAELARQEDFVRRFCAEATAVARLTHPNVVQIHFVGEDHGHHFFAMQYVEGESLSEMLARRGRLPPDQALPIVGQALAALAAAHKQGIIHRDIKPANILLDRVNRRALLADFGLVKSVVAGTKMTATGIVLGTVDYISPEQGRGQAVDARSDLYSIGVLMYQMLSGSLPFEADSPTAMIFQHVYEQPKPLRDAAPQVPEALCTIVHRLLAKSPPDRHQTAEEVLADIRAFRAGQPLSSARGSAAAAQPNRPETVIVEAPEFAEAPPWPAELDREAPVSRWPRLVGRLRERGQRIRQRLLGLAGDRTPDFVQRLQNTQQQVDGAVAEYERRQDRLQQLVSEAAEVLQELKRQAAEHRRSAAEAQRRAQSAIGDDEVRQAGEEQAACQRAGDELDELIAQQERELEAMHLRLAQVNATLQKIRSQRDLLNARFQVAQAKIQLATGPAARPRTLVLTAVRIAVLVVAGSLIVGSVAYYWPRKPKVDRDLIVLPAVPVPPRTTIPVPRYPTPPAERPPLVPDIGGTPISPGSSTAEVAPLSSEYVVQKFPGLGWGVTSLAFSPDGRHLAIGKMDAAVLLFEIESGRRLSAQTELRELSQITALCFAPDGQRLFIGGNSGIIQVWGLGSGGVLGSAGLSDALSGHRRAVRCIAAAPDGSFLVSGGEDNRLIWQQPGATTQVRNLASFRASVRAARLTSDGTTAIASDGRELAWVDWRTATVTRTFPLKSSYTHGVSISPDGARVACSYGSDITTWETETAQMQTLDAEHRELQWCVLFTPDGRRLLSGGRGCVSLWDMATGRQTATISLGSILYVQTIAVSRDGTLLAAVPSAAGQTLYVFRLPQGTR